MIRIEIKWTDKLLTLGACGGDLTVFRINPLTGMKNDLILKGRVKVERYSYGYENINWGAGITADDFEKYLKPYLDVMLRSYHRGMILKNLDFTWIDDWKVEDV